MDGSSSPSWNVRLRQERIRHNWRQQDMADQLGTTTVTIKRWERGSQQPGAYFRLKLCALFGKSAEELGLLEEQSRERQPPDPSLEASSPAQEQRLPLWHVPFPRNPFFTGREELLHHLSTVLQRDHKVALSQSYTLSGLGGIGKTQAALEYIYRYASDYLAVFWINAETPETLFSTFVALAELLDLPEQVEREQHRVVAAVMRWLNSHEGWLLVFDNVEEIDLVKDVLPSARTGSLLFTSRKQALGLGTKTLDLDKMPPEEGLRFLLHRARLLDPAVSLDQLRPADAEAARTIVAMLDGLPLALDQAGAYIEATRCSLSDYLSLLQSAPLRLLAEREAHVEHPLSVIQTFTLAFESLERSNTHAAELLTVCALVAPEAIPERLFLEGATQLGAIFEALAADPFAFQTALKALLAYSLLQRHAGTQTLSIHRLVQMVLRGHLSRPGQAEWITRVIHALDYLFPDPSQSQQMESWSWCEQLVPHALHVLSTSPDVPETQEASSLWHKTADYLYHRSRYPEAESYHQHALGVREQMLGTWYPKLSVPLIGLVETTSSLGKYSSTIRYAQRIIDLLERTRGASHFGLITPLNMRAYAYQAQGWLAEAEQLLLRSLLIWTTMILQETSGPEPSSSATPRQVGKERHTEALIHQALSLWEQAPTHHHDPVGQALTFLSHVYQQQQRYEEAEAILLPALRLGKLALGEHHYILTTPQMILAEVYKGQGRLAEAEACYLQVLAIREEVLGPWHVQTLEARAGYAALLRALDREEEAVRIEKPRSE